MRPESAACLYDAERAAEPIRSATQDLTAGRYVEDWIIQGAVERQFAAKHKVALADASLRWGHLVKEGIPYVTLEANSINHPDDRGHEMFARSLMELFGGAK